MDPMYTGSIISSLCTIAGAVPAMFLKHVSHRGRDILLAYTAGIMVAASTYGLIPSAMKLSNIYVLTIGVLLGTVALTFLDSCLPHMELERKEHPFQGGHPLLLIAMTFHNIPEGLSVGVSYGSHVADLGPLVSFAIGLQNVPEGFLVALYLVSHGVKPIYALLCAASTGILELAFGIIGISFAGQFSAIVPYGLAFAAGAMLFVVYKELIPESHGDGNERSATFSFIGGLLTMIALTHFIR
ncbi:ZIP family metal transporter [Ectobacillus antri]|uniref:ZIP family metal transporter n=1 Tax=Ectobacillus antri TaxID=2486280 RepID=A0ABT6H6I1_9BACI|nr:ZIP family metal transporter [Ectobacillus antri]MDG4656823.1 ZIP family metal transporter [Ectobacillus antri]MDG5754280.1 ZIP family metal transporter [Ectobacillus antri]